jgi:hypothetical protein
LEEAPPKINSELPRGAGSPSNVSSSVREAQSGASTAIEVTTEIGTASYQK